ncbi:MAG: hypothetical protein LBU11_06415 [Zoogloeaceae bacterium]|jgi:hypothetical protein|nr:hypothetical protein [Zoogloeaceae bacterium]
MVSGSSRSLFNLSRLVKSEARFNFWIAASLRSPLSTRRGKPRQKESEATNRLFAPLNCNDHHGMTRFREWEIMDRMYRMTG